MWFQEVFLKDFPRSVVVLGNPQRLDLSGKGKCIIDSR